MKNYQSPTAFISILPSEDILRTSDITMKIPSVQEWEKGKEQTGNFNDLF